MSNYKNTEIYKLAVQAQQQREWHKQIKASAHCSERLRVASKCLTLAAA